MSDDQRYYVAQAFGPRGSYKDHEYAVVDRMTGLTVGLFMVTSSSAQSWQSFAALKREAHGRARRHCHALNLASIDVEVRSGVVGADGGDRLPPLDPRANGNHVVDVPHPVEVPGVGLEVEGLPSLG
jgi:hypothetical protein